MASKNKTKLTRRNFLKCSSIGFLGAGVIGRDIGSVFDEKNEEELPKIKAYRTLGRTGFKVSDISSGAPLEEAILKLLIKSGVNYIDTSGSYFNGNSERIIGKCIKEFDRNSIFITTKIWHENVLKSRENILLSVRKSLENLQTDYIDCFMIHQAESSEIVKNENFHSVIKQLKSEGRIRFCGVSCHGKSWVEKPKETMEDVLMTAINDGRFDVLLLVYNFLQQDMSERILKACKEKNIGTTIMKSNPVKGYFNYKAWAETFIQDGKEVPEFINNVVKLLKEKSDQARSYIKYHNFSSNDEMLRDIAIPFVLSNSDVNTVLIYYENFDDIENHLKLSGMTLANSDKKTLKDYKNTFGSFHCRHACGLCENKCPYKLPINTIMRYNYYFEVQKREKYAMENYAKLNGLKAKLCYDCKGLCEKACPYHVSIQGLLNYAHKNLTLT